MASRRSLATTTAAAGALLAALWFVPSASASVEHPVPAAHRPAATATHEHAPAGVAALNLADTGSVDTTPYVVGGTGFLAVGAALVLIARRRALTAL